MSIRTVGPNSTYATIADAVDAAAEGDIIRLTARAGYERAELTVQDLTVTGGDDSLRIDLELGVGINDVTLRGLTNFTVQDNAGANVITGNGGSSSVYVSGGADVVHGGDGHDQLFVNYVGPASIVATEGSITDGATNSVTYDGIEYVIISTGSGDDSVTTDDGDYSVSSGSGNDTISVGDGRNTVEAGAGNDTVTTGDGNNMVVLSDFEAQGDDTVTTGSGNDYVESGSGDDILKTGGGDDDVFIEGGIDAVDAGAGHDVLFVNYIRLRTGVTVNISSGSVAEGYSGSMTDASGRNSVSFTGVEDFHIQAGKADDDVRVGGGDDTVWSRTGNDVVHAGAGNDHLDGGSNHDRLIGGQGDDYLNGSVGYDTLVGGQGEDTLSGGRGNDTLIGAQGADFLHGGSGADVFRFDDLASLLGADDLIGDLNDVEDTIDLSRIDADVTAAGDQAFVLVDRFSGAAGEAVLRYQADDRVTRLALDTDGDGAADIAIIATGNHSTFENFVL